MKDRRKKVRHFIDERLPTWRNSMHVYMFWAKDHAYAMHNYPDYEAATLRDRKWRNSEHPLSFTVEGTDLTIISD